MIMHPIDPEKLRLVKREDNCPDCGFSVAEHGFEENTNRAFSLPKSNWQKTQYCDSLLITDLVDIIYEDKTIWTPEVLRLIRNMVIAAWITSWTLIVVNIIFG